MDSLTQVVLGAAVGEAVLGKKIGNRAMLWGAIAGTIPDLDVFVKYFTDPITATELHRGFSHSIVFSVLMAPLLAWVAHKIHKRREATRWGWTQLFFWSLVTHPLLDAHTTWGTQLFWPFDYRLSYKNIFVVDPLYTVPFLICLIIAMCLKRTNPRRRLFNNAGLIISSSYMVLTLLFKWVTFSEFEERLAEQHIEYVDLDTKPTPLNSVLWNAQISTETGYRVAYYSLFDSQKIEFSEEFPRNDYLLDDIREQKVVQQLLKISAGWYMVREEPDRLVFIDLRFGQMGVDPNESVFLWQFELLKNADGTVSCNRLQDHLAGVDIGEALQSLWGRMGGN